MTPFKSAAKLWLRAWYLDLIYGIFILAYIAFAIYSNSASYIDFEKDTLAFSMYAFAVEFLRILSACVLYFGIAYFACVVTKLTSVSLFLLILYTLASAICRSHEIVFPFYMSQTLIDGETAVKLCLPLFAAGILLCAAGRLAEKRLRTNIR